MNQKNVFKALGLACAAALLSACATTGPASSQAMSPYRDSIEVAGRLSVNYDKGGQPETLSGKFTWSQTPAAVDVALLSPLGQTIATIRVTPESATLTQSDKTPRVARDIDTLAAQTLGWSLPVSGLRDWLQGYATGADGQRFVASPASNTVTTPDGWRLTFVSWQEARAGAGAGAALAGPAPKRIDAQRSASATSGELALRIVIDLPG